jgi:hypothetical protein
MTIPIGILGAAIIVVALTAAVIYLALHPEIVPLLKFGEWLIGKMWNGKITVRPADPSDPAMRKAEGNDNSGVP